MSIPRNLSIIADTLNSDGTFASISNTGSTTLSSGTANGVSYLNGSKVLTSGTALSFDGTNLAIGTTTYSSIASSLSTLSLGGTNANVSGGIAYQVNGTVKAYQYVDTGGIFTHQALTGINQSFLVNNAEAMRLTTTGLGIGTTSPNRKLVVSNAGAQGFEFGAGVGTGSGNEVLNYNRSTSLYIQKTEYASSYTFVTGTAGNVTAATIDSSGNVGIGTSSPVYKLEVTQDQNAGTYARVRNNNAGSSAYAGIIVNASGNTWAMRMGSSAANSNSLEFVLDIAGTPSTKAVIDSSGNLLVGTTSGITSGGVVIQPVSGQSTIYIGHITGTGSSASYSEFYYAGTKIGSITQSGTTAVLYNTTSDQRLKENIQDAESASDLIDSLQVRQFDWKTDNTHQRYGFIAQELVAVAPEAVHQPADPDEMMAVDYSKLVPMLVKEIQLLRKRLAALEST